MASILTTTICLSRSLRLATTTKTIKPYSYTLPSIFPKFPTKVSVKRRRFVTMASDHESPAKNKGLRDGPPDEATKDYFMQQTMFRIKDPERSLKFYSKVLGMSLLKRLDFPDMKFSLYFMGYEDTSDAPPDSTARTRWTFEKKATIELTHNWGTEKEPNFTGYHNGNSEPRGFGHIGITVDDIDKACKRFESLSVDFVKKPEDGKMKGIAFIKDPDGYWIEIFDTASITNVAEASAPKKE